MTEQEIEKLKEEKHDLAEINRMLRWQHDKNIMRIIEIEHLLKKDETELEYDPDFNLFTGL